MTRRYTHDDSQEVRRKTQALMPEGVECTATLLRDGWQLNLVVCGRTSCHTYEFGPGITDLHMVKVAGQWKSGDRDVSHIPAADDVKTTGQFADNRDEMTYWARTARVGDRVVYFRGNLAQFRAEAGPRIVALQAQADASRTGKPLPPQEHVTLMDLQAKQDLLEAVQHLSRANVVSLVQERLADGTGFTYYAVKR